jgi:dipeptidyl aminopeptidase/acylaminoacyl peptidase
VLDFAGYLGAADVGVAFARDELLGLPWERQAWILEHDPLHHAHRIRTPTLVSCGEDDLRTPIAAAENLFVRLKLAGVETELVRYPGGSHRMPWTGFAEHRADHLRRVLAWFQGHLGGG